MNWTPITVARFDRAQADRDRRHPACNLDAVLGELGTTRIWTGALFLTPDGVLIDGSESNNGGCHGLRSLDHRYVSDDLIENETETGPRTKALMRWMFATGCARLIVTDRFFGVGFCTEPTREQRDAITSRLAGSDYETVMLEVLDASADHVAHHHLSMPMQFQVRNALREIGDLINQINL